MEFAVGVNHWSLKLLGIWPRRDSLSDVRFLITISLITSVVVPQLIDLFRYETLSMDVIDNLSSLMPCVLVMIKLVIIRVNMNRLNECLNGMEEDWVQDWKPEFSHKCHRIMTNNAKIGRAFNIFCNILLYVTAVGFLSLPYTISDPAGMEGLKAENSTRSISAHRRLPLKTIYFFDPYRSPIFEFIYFQQCVSIVAGATSNFSIDSFLALLGLHFCGQFEILGINIEHYSGIVKHDQSNQIYSGSCTCISCIIEKHLRIMRYSEILEESFNLMLLVQIFGNSILFCFLGYQVIMKFEDSEAIGIATFLIFMLTMMFHLFLYCYVGEQIMRTSSALGYYAYKVKWYNLETTAVKPLILLIARSQRPLRLTAGKFFDMSLETYTDILKTSATYLSFLRAVRE